MRAFVGFVWSDRREVNGEWRYELSKPVLEKWAQITAMKRGFELCWLFNNLSDVQRYYSGLLRRPVQNKNIIAAVKSFLDYVDRTQKDIFIDNQPHDRAP